MMKCETDEMDVLCESSLALVALDRRDDELLVVRFVPLLCCCCCCGVPDMVGCVRVDVYGLFDRERVEALALAMGDDDRSLALAWEAFLAFSDDAEFVEGLFARCLCVEERLSGEHCVVVWEDVDGGETVGFCRISLSVPLTISMN